MTPPSMGGDVPPVDRNRESMDDLELLLSALPDEVVRRPKHGFEMPVDAWLRQPLRDVFESTVLAPHAKVGGLINQETARKLYHAHLVRTGRHGNVLWSLLILGHWADRYLRHYPE